jgi:penicillin-binding protein 2
VGIKKMSTGFKRYGLGIKTGIDLPNEWIGIVPSREWKREKYNKSWYKGETLNTSIGQGSFLTTPMQIARYTALMATGKLPIPHIAKIVDEKEYSPKPLEVLSKLELKKLPLIQKAMYEVCNHKKGTATKYIDINVTIAGKTGTAQVIAIKQDVKKRMKEHNMEYYNRSHAWFTTYGPYENPQYVVSVLVEHGGHGGSAAGEVVSKIYNKLLELGYIKQESSE